MQKINHEKTATKGAQAESSYGHYLQLSSTHCLFPELESTTLILLNIGTWKTELAVARKILPAMVT